MVRAGNDNELAEEIGEKRIVAIGWDKIGILSEYATRSTVKEQYDSTYQDHSKHRRSIIAGQLYRFAYEINDVDYVLSYVKTDRAHIQLIG
jgi:predicted Mrr-cat superfamily restriction endonuclease